MLDLSSGPAEAASVRTFNLEQIKESVARDLEALLNTRRGLSEQVLDEFEQTRHSILSYGMDDFVSLTLLNPNDRNFICQSIERAISHHEPRLRQVRVFLEVDGSSTQRLKFAIHALLVLNPSEEPVSFDAMLQTMTQQYSVHREARHRAS
jgi:type VI secretion system protein ImpF